MSLGVQPRSSWLSYSKLPAWQTLQIRHVSERKSKLASVGYRPGANTPRITHFIRFRALRRSETRRESCILRGSKHFGAAKHAANHAFYKVSSTSEKSNTPRIRHFTRFRALRRSATCCGSRILRGFEHSGKVKHAANHAFYDVPITSEQ